MPIGENTQKLSCSPEGMLTPKVAYEICELVVDAVRTMVRGSAPVTEATSTFLLVACQPLVTNATADTVASAELGHCEPIAERIGNELNSLFHR
jgi:hypothetical protein